MAIEEELSGDIAIALLAGGERDPERLKKLRDVVLMIDTALRRIADDTKSISFKPGGERTNTVGLGRAES